ncbi:hypothetical protein ABZV75_39725 [Streptomyces flaveolus]|uniref:hypothetical protein n=1 Tax=Streptomyces flaveolus TaxID=67297 RepID=UPI0033ABEB71
MEHFRGEEMTQGDIDLVCDAAMNQGFALYDGRRWRLTRRGHRIFEEYAGDRKRMTEEEKKRHQPSIKIDARGAGTVAHTITGDVYGNTVNNTTPSSRKPTEVDLDAVMQLLERLRLALPDIDGLSESARGLAERDINDVDEELRAAEEERDPSRIRNALTHLRTTFLGVDGIVQVVNQLWSHLRVLFPS